MPGIRRSVRGALEDPAGLLRPGSNLVSEAFVMRSFKITSLDDVRRPELRAMVGAATQHVAPASDG